MKAVITMNHKSINVSHSRVGFIVAIGMCVVITVAVKGYCFFSACQFEKESDKLYGEISYLQKEVNRSSNINMTYQSDALCEISGVDVERVNRDKQIADGVFREIMNWSDFDTYHKIREKLISEYHLDENGRFLSVFMPEVIQTPPTLDGSVYNRIDQNHLNVNYEGMESHVCAIEDDVYKYISFVEWSTHDVNGNESFATVVFLYQINAEGVMFNFDAYTLVP